MKAKGEQTQASGRPDKGKSWDLEHSPKIFPLPTWKHMTSLGQKTKMTALFGNDMINKKYVSVTLKINTP